MDKPPDVSDFNQPSGEEWDDPDPLEWAVDLPEYPVDAWPDVYRDFIVALSVETQTPVDLAGAAVHGVLAGCIGGKFWVKPRPGWSEPCNEYLVCALPSGARKTPVLAAAREPLDLAERQLREAAAPSVRDSQTKYEVKRRYAEKLVADAAKSSNEAALIDAQEAVNDAESLVVQVMPRLIAGDATPEALVTLLAEHEGRIVAVSDEAGLFSSLTGRTYSDRAAARLDYILQAYSASEIRIDRQGRASQTIEKPCLTLVSTIQPFALARIVADEENMERGVISRVLWSIPKDNVGYRAVNAPAIPEHVRKKYVDEAKKLATDMADVNGQKDLEFTPQALRHLQAFMVALEPQMRPGERLYSSGLRAWASKLAGHIVRASAAIHAARHGSKAAEHNIDHQTVAAAERIGYYYLEHAVAIHRASNKAASKRQSLVMKTLADPQWSKEKADPKTGGVSLRDLLRKLSRTFNGTTELRDVLETLESSGWIRLKESTRGQVLIHVHPQAGKHLKSVDSADRTPKTAGQTPIAPQSDVSTPMLTHVDRTEGTAETSTPVNTNVDIIHLDQKLLTSGNAKNQPPVSTVNNNPPPSLTYQADSPSALPFKPCGYCPETMAGHYGDCPTQRLVATS